MQWKKQSEKVIAIEFQETRTLTVFREIVTLAKDVEEVMNYLKVDRLMLQDTVWVVLLLTGLLCKALND